MVHHTCFLTLLVVAALSSCPAVAQRSSSPPISLELMAEPGFPRTRQQRWLNFLQQFGFTDVRIRGAQPDDVPRVINRGTAAAPRYRVEGLLTDRGVMQLPGVVIRYGQRKQLQQWLDRLRRGGTEAVTAATGVFGLSENQLLKVRDVLKAPVRTKTKDQPVRTVIQQLASGLELPVRIDSGAERKLNAGEKVRDELLGLSRGTALVAVIRPLGLDLVPTTYAGGQLALRIVPAGQSRERWPLGWKPAKSPAQLAPALFDFLPVEIVDTPLNEALGAIRQRTHVPILFDYNKLAKREVDLAQKVSLKPTKTFYKKIIDRLLFQAKLRSDLRVDDGDQPFLWVTTIGR